jgi:hypothetical protein
MGRILKIQIPEVLASELASKGLAEVQRTARSAAWELAWNAASAMSVVVTLVQTPEVLKAFADDCLRLLRGDQKSQHGVRLDAKGPGGEISLYITPETDVYEVLKFLQKVIFVDTKVEDEAK